MTTPKIDMNRFRASFLEEAEELLAALETGLIGLDSAPTLERLNDIFRAAHSVKGGSATFGFPAIAEVAHGLETVLDRMRCGEAETTPELVNALLGITDHLIEIVRAARAEEPVPDNSAVLAGIATLLGCEPTPSAAIRAEVAAAEARTDLAAVDELEGLFGLFESEAAAAGNCDTSAAGVAAPTPETPIEMPAVHAAAAESTAGSTDAATSAVAVTTSNAPELSGAAAHTSGTRAPRPSRNRGGGQDKATIRVAVDKVDRLLEFVGELAVARSLLAGATRATSAHERSGLRYAVEQFQRATTDLQTQVMSLRQVALGSTMSRLRRAIRDSTARTGRRVTLQLKGEQIEVDRRVADRLTPLLADVLIGLAEGTGASGEELTIELRFVVEGELLRVELDSNGAEPTEELFLAQVDLESVNGTLHRMDAGASGTRIQMTIPRSLELLDGFFVVVGGRQLVVPLARVREGLDPRSSTIHTLQGQVELLQYAGESLQLIRLHEMFRIPGAVTELARGRILVVSDGDTSVGLLVDEIHACQKVVTKSLDQSGLKTAGVLAATVLPDGRVALILDIPSLIRLSQRPSHEEQPAASVDTAGLTMPCPA